MPSQFRCVGRLFPNAPPPGVVGTAGRVAPRVFQVKWEQGEGVAEPRNGIWQNIYFTTFEAPGFDPRVNWNGDLPGRPAVNVFVAVTPGVEVRMVVHIKTLRPDGNVNIDVFTSDGFASGIDWSTSDTIDCPYTTTIGNPRVILDESIPLRRGTYGRIPPGSCIGA